MATTWMVRAGEGGYLIDEFRTKSVIAIGWSDLPDLAGIKSKDELRKLIDQEYDDSSEVQRRSAASTIWKFMKEIKVGDSVISYNRTDRTYLVGEVTGEYRRDASIEDFNNVRSVKWVGTVNRDDLTEDSRRSIGAIQTLFMVAPEVWAEIQRLLGGETPLVSPEVLSDEMEGDAEVATEKVPATDKRGYEIPLLQLMKDGKSERKDLIESLFRKVEKLLLPGDLRIMANGGPVWRYRAIWALTYLNRDGHARNSQLGTWEITEQGLKRLDQEKNWSMADSQTGSTAVVRLEDGKPVGYPSIQAVSIERAPTLFKPVGYDVGALLTEIERGDIALPDIQRPFVWKASKVRDLFDSMYRGFPVGSLMLWATTENNNTKKIGLNEKARAASYLVIDGQQRLTSLYSVLLGKPVLDENFQEIFLEIAFRPGDGRFEVPDAAIKRDPEFVPNISDLWVTKKPVYRLIKEFIERLKNKRTVTSQDEDAISNNLERLVSLNKYPFPTLEVTRNVDEEAVADIFVRVNNGGSKLGQSDFILTLLSVFSPETRRSLEDFARRGSAPGPRGEASPFNHLVEPQADQLVRVAIALGFYRAKLSAMYQLLRGKDPETDNISPALREKQFQQLEEAVTHTLDLNYWHLFLGHILGAGFRSRDLISSETALFYSYALYLIGKLQCNVEEKTLGRLISRWFFAASIMGRYSGSSETAMEEDLSLIRDLREAEAFEKALNAAMNSVITKDFWEITVPQDLETSSSISPAARGFQVAQIRLGAPVLFSDRQIVNLFDPAIQAKRKTIEGHHLFPKAWLRAHNVSDTKRINQVANLASVEWPDNADVSSAAPAEYVPTLRKQFTDDAWNVMCSMHALPPNWEQLPYDEFLAQRRRLMAKIIRRGFEALGGQDAGLDVRQAAGADEKETWSLIEKVEVELRALVRRKYTERWRDGAEGRLLKVFSDKERADFELRRTKHQEAYPLSPGQISDGDFLEYLYLSDLARLVTASETWDQFSPIFDKRKDQLQDKLRQILPVRNDRAHFRRVPENELLRCKLACSDLLTLFRRTENHRQ